MILRWLNRPPGLPDPGEVSGTIRYDLADTGHIAFDTAIGSGTIEDWEYWVGETGIFFSFSGYLKKWDVKGMQKDGLITADFAIRCTSTITRTVD